MANSHKRDSKWLFSSKNAYLIVKGRIVKVGRTRILPFRTVKGNELAIPYNKFVSSQFKILQLVKVTHASTCQVLIYLFQATQKERRFVCVLTCLCVKYLQVLLYDKITVSSTIKN